MKVLVVNPGTTSTKIGAFDEDRELFYTGIDHDAATLKAFTHVVDQMPYRKELVTRVVKERGFSLSDFDAVCGRGGLFRPIPSGTYTVNDKVIEDIRHWSYGEHASNLGAYIARELADTAGIPAFFVDPVCVDEMEDVARVSGLNGVERHSLFHALNHKAVARKAAVRLGKPYEALNLVVSHLGGGVSVAAHRKGRVVDVFNVKDDGSMGMDRAGSIPVTAVIDICYSGKTKEEVTKLIMSGAGVYSYTGIKDFREVEKRAFSGDDEAALIFRALAYQLAKDIGAMAAVLSCAVDAVILTGGMAFSDRLCDEISSYISRLAPVIRIPGEEEMRSLAEGALRVLHGEKPGEYI